MSVLPPHRFLNQRGIRWERRTFSPDTPKGAAAVARALGFREGQMVKTLIFRAGTGERVLVGVGGDRSVISGKLKKAIGNRNIQLARPEEVLEHTGYAIGSIPPFGWEKPPMRTLLDRALLREPVLGVGAGVWGEEILIAPEDLVRAADAHPVNLTEREET